MGKISQKITYEIRNDLFHKLQDTSLSYFDKRSSGDIMSITTNDVTQLNMLVGGQFVYIISSVVGLVLTLFVMFFLNPYLTLLSLLIFPVFFFFSYLFRKVAMGLFKESRKTIGKVTSSIQENIAGAKVVQSYGQEKRASTEFDEANIANYNAMLRIRKFMATIFPLIGLVTTVITAGVLLAGGFAVLGNVSVFGIPVSVGVLSAFISILSQFFKPFMMLMQIQEIFASALAASDRIYSLLNEKVEILETDDPVKLETISGEINFNSVSFGYTLENGDKTNKEALPLHGEPKILRPIEMSRPVEMPKNPMMQQMMKRALNFMKALPEPHSSFMLKNVMYMPQNIRQKLFMNLMSQNPSDAPIIIDGILAEFNYAVPGTDSANNHPEFQTSFKQAGEKTVQEETSLIPDLPPEEILQMTKFLEKSLQSKATIQSSSSGMGEGGGMMGGGMSRMPPKSMLRMLASIDIKKEVYDQIPKVVRDAIDEQKKLIQHEQSKGYVLKNVILDIPPGKTMAIVGETGSGKTTITKLISRF
jgi:ABC-type multidrug transport system fused ATPase/permease subunit